MTDQLVDVGGYREQLRQRLESLAAWRAREAAAHPDDERNAQSTTALRVAATEVAALADDDPTLLGLATVCQAHNDAELAFYIEREDQIVGHHGFGDGAEVTQSTDDLLAALTKAAHDAERRSG
jgi:hypothetical protein